MMSRATQTHLAGHMQPAGRVFETPVRYYIIDRVELRVKKGPIIKVH